MMMIRGITRCCRLIIAAVAMQRFVPLAKQYAWLGWRKGWRDETANLNAPGQIVISGTEDGVHQLSDLALSNSAKKVIPLPVSVAAHSSLMIEQSTFFKEFIANININKPDIPVVNNVDVKVEEDENLIKDALVRQLFSSVRWVETIEYMEQQGVDIMLELGPGKVLTSFNKRIDNSIKSLSVSDSNSLESALDILSSL